MDGRCCFCCRWHFQTLYFIYVYTHCARLWPFGFSINESVSCQMLINCHLMNIKLIKQVWCEPECQCVCVLSICFSFVYVFLGFCLCFLAYERQRPLNENNGDQWSCSRLRIQLLASRITLRCIQTLKKRVQFRQLSLIWLVVLICNVRNQPRMRDRDKEKSRHQETKCTLWDQMFVEKHVFFSVIIG